MIQIERRIPDRNVMAVPENIARIQPSILVDNRFHTQSSCNIALDYLSWDKLLQQFSQYFNLTFCIHNCELGYSPQIRLPDQYPLTMDNALSWNTVGKLQLMTTNC
jgi:hypothetical protein